MAPQPASASASRAVDGGYGRVFTTSAVLYSDFESLMGDVRKGFMMMKSVATDLERENRPDLVSKLEEAVHGLLETSEDCSHRAAAVKAVGSNFYPGDQPTNFKKLMEEELAKIKKGNTLSGQNHHFIRQFKEAVWNVHHAGQPMPGEEQEELVMMNTQSNLLNTICPLTGKSVTALEEPVRNVECKHVYDRKAVMIYIQSSSTLRKCPVAGCPKQLFAEKVYCDGTLPMDIEEMRSRNTETDRLYEVEDFTMLDED